MATKKIINTLEEEIVQTPEVAQENDASKRIEIEAKYLRALADADNLAKQHSLDITNARKSGKKSIIAPVVELVNTLQLALQFVPSDCPESMKKIIDTMHRAIQKSIEDLKLLGVELLLPSVGATCDPELMQPLNAGINNTVASVVSAGYKVDGVLVAPSVVMLD